MTNDTIDQPCGDCLHKARIMGWYCEEADAPLRSNHLGAIRRYECVRDHLRAERTSAGEVAKAE